MKPAAPPIFIVEDNEVYAKSLQHFIQTRFPELNDIKHFRIGELCLLELSRNPDIVIMDYILNSRYKAAGNGIDIIKRIKTEKPLTNIIVLSSQKNSPPLSEAIKQYDCTYIHKDDHSFERLEKIIKSIHNTHQNN